MTTKRRLHFDGEPWQETFNDTVYNEISSPRPWVTWWEEGGNPFAWDAENDQGYLRPECKRISRVAPYLDPPRILDGEDYAYQSFTFFGVHHSGLYQQIEVPTGATVRAKGYAHAWYSTEDDPRQSTGGPGDFTQMVGIDPAGGVDPFASTVVWSAPVSNYDTYQETSAAEVVAAGTTVTIFTREWVKWRFKHADGQWGAVDIEIEEDSPTPPVVPSNGHLGLEEVIAILVQNWPAGEPPVTPGDDVAGMTPYSQRDPEWAGDIMVTRTLGQAGCATTASAIISSLVDKTLTPGGLNAKLKLIGGYTPVGHVSGPDLLYWAKVAEAVTGLHYGGYTKWLNGVADMAVVRAALAGGPVILGVDYNHSGVYNSHFVVGYELTEDGQDIKIVDPWHGDTTTLLARYGAEGWDLSRAIYAMAVFTTAPPTPSNAMKVGLHVQNWTPGTADYIAAVQPAVVKVFHTEDIARVWELQPDAIVVYRHWVDNDAGYLGGDIPANVQHYVNKFTSALLALGDIPQVQQGLLAAESINEVMAGPNVPRAVEFDREFIRVLRQKLPLVKPVVATIPVGNPGQAWFPALLSLAKEVTAAGGYMGYHNYWTARAGVSFLESDWQWYAGRFEAMQDYFVQNGASPNWIFGETGAIKIETSGHMPPDAGWVECLGGLDKYVADVVTYNRLLNASRYADNVVGGCLFTVNSEGGWGNFRHDDHVLAEIARGLT